MQFLKTLFWVVLTIILVLFAKANWTLVEVRLWGGLVADVRLPVLVFAAFFLGLVPTLILYRARLWSLRRRLDPVERTVAPPVSPATPVTVSNAAEERVATDSKAWPAT